MMTDEEIRAGLENVVADAMMQHGPDGHCDGYEEITAAALRWLKANDILVDEDYVLARADINECDS